MPWHRIESHQNLHPQRHCITRIDHGEGAQENRSAILSGRPDPVRGRLSGSAVDAGTCARFPPLSVRLVPMSEPARADARVRVFVTGRGTSLGRAVIAELLARGLSVTVFGTGYEDDFKGLVTLLSDLSETSVIRSVAKRLDAVIHCEQAERRTTLSVAAALCEMLAAMPPHGRLISATGVTCPDCPYAAEIDRAILSAARCVPQSAYVLAPSLLSSACPARVGIDTRLQPISRGLRVPSLRELTTTTVEDCARLLACLAENGAFKGGVVACPASAARVPAESVDPKRFDFGDPKTPEDFGYRASPEPLGRRTGQPAFVDKMSSMQADETWSHIAPRIFNSAADRRRSDARRQQ
ncbi:hypothetical protein SAMN04488020_1254 [Palleronia marisminoris]|uniref:Uncharacterized protein n=1 Tax=Palleronia marisminoris TaxID=315423 RepID=A0A1Y5TYU7_9RHOB|nr:hypothetical protein [Palleronia marisminoris]SFH55419.1 hypothetical protein SAMN04488020_1254 [Palleronia marisminoris]SLN71460.1 hypothetical protein PAM7066_03664 [Palleronia marisminoris]